MMLDDKNIGFKYYCDGKEIPRHYMQTVCGNQMAALSAKLENATKTALEEGWTSVTADMVYLGRNWAIRRVLSAENTAPPNSAENRKENSDTMLMSDDELRTAYRSAADKREQVSVLADRCMVKSWAMEEYLEKIGVTVDTYFRDKHEKMLASAERARIAKEKKAAKKEDARKRSEAALKAAIEEGTPVTGSIYNVPLEEPLEDPDKEPEQHAMTPSPSPLESPAPAAEDPKPNYMTVGQFLDIMNQMDIDVTSPMTIGGKPVKSISVRFEPNGQQLLFEV